MPAVRGASALIESFLRRSTRGRAHEACPLSLVQDAPPAVQSLLPERDVVGLAPSPPPKQHWMYAVDNDRVLHVFGAPDDRLRRGLAARTRIAADVPEARVPTLHAVEEHGGRLWLLEDRVPGDPLLAGDRATWFPDVAAWLTHAAGPAGPPLRETSYWTHHHLEAIAATPPEHRAVVERAWEVTGTLPARVLHGDAQPKNLLRSTDFVALVDWEGPWRHGMPGLDMLFLLVMSSSVAPDAAAVAALADGRDPPDRPVTAALAAVGLDEALLPAALLAVLSTWSLGESRRRARSARRVNARPFQDLLHAHVEVLSRQL